MNNENECINVKQKEDPFGSLIGNLRPVDLMKNTNLPDWARTKAVQDKDKPI